MKNLSLCLSRVSGSATPDNSARRILEYFQNLVHSILFNLHSRLDHHSKGQMIPDVHHQESLGQIISSSHLISEA